MLKKIIGTDYLPKHADVNGWKERHKRAILGGHPVATALRAWLNYAQRHADAFGSDIGSDYVLGDAWADWGWALRKLLNGDLGEMDAGTLDHIIAGNLEAQGWNADTEERKP